LPLHPHIKLHSYVLRLLHRSTSCRPHGVLVLLLRVRHKLQLSVLLSECTATDTFARSYRRSKVTSSISKSSFGSSDKEYGLQPAGVGLCEGVTTTLTHSSCVTTTPAMSLRLPELRAMPLYCLISVK
jgi:hypothetical protein